MFEIAYDNPDSEINDLLDVASLPYMDKGQIINISERFVSSLVDVVEAIGQGLL